MTGGLREALADYLAMRRALGYRLVRRVPLLNRALGVDPRPSCTAKRPLFVL